ncbi:Alpha/Beta hydrolase protein [Cyathus striatus]|nr:Alpha/Beta hydrolase protein [Cyathus striatus]
MRKIFCLAPTMLPPLISLFLLSLTYLSCAANNIQPDQSILDNATQHGSLHLSSLSSDRFTSLSHPRFPNYQVRVKKIDFCDPTVNVYTGYLDVDAGAKHMFFYFFESRRNPDQDDVMMWINGGLFAGPCSIDMKNASTNGTTWNPYSWNEEPNILLRSAVRNRLVWVGVGFSYADFGEVVETTEAAAKNVHAFISIFFETFKQFSGRPFHISGESYGGRYLPVFASEIYDQNQVALKEGNPMINLQSVLIGNGITDISTLYQGRYDVECGTASFDVPFQSISACVQMKLALPRCQSAMQKACIDHFDAMNCRAAVNFCDSELSTAMEATGRNVYDMSKKCEGNLCYREIDSIESYLNRPDIRELLGGFNAHMDKWNPPTQHYVASLLDRTYDWRCNWIANKLWVDKLDWSGKAAYNDVDWKEWGVGGQKAGEVKQTPLLTFATVRGAGHMITESLAMVSRWLAGKSLW